MLLGIPGGNTFANYYKANRSFLDRAAAEKARGGRLCGGRGRGQVRITASRFSGAMQHAASLRRDASQNRDRNKHLRP
jgi:hypothetical protein